MTDLCKICFKKTIGKHVNNALREELQGMATVAEFAIVQNEGSRSVVRNVTYCAKRVKKNGIL